MTAHTTWVEVSTGALAHNLAQIRALVGPKIRIMAVVKANAYGHGTVETAKVFAKSGANYLGVTSLEEGLELRTGGLSLPILVFSPLLAEQIESAIEADLDLTVCDLATGQAIASAVDHLGKRARIQLKVDTGMGRLGADPDDCPNIMYNLLHMGLEIAGVYTHFANSSAEDLSHARKQNSVFSSVLGVLRSKDIPTGLCHASNSGAILTVPDAVYDMVRPGTVLYGQYPSRHLNGKLDLKDTWSLKTRITAIRKFPAGTPIGYGSEFTTKHPTTVAVIPVGYAEGFTMIPESVARRSSTPIRAIASRLLRVSNAPHVTVRGSKAPVVGRISMQMCSIDVTDIPGIHVGDEVTVPSRRVTTSSRIPRVYVD